MAIVNVVAILDNLHPDYVRTVKPCIWFPRSWCLKSNIHPGTTISLISGSKGIKCFAPIKLYSKYSELFCDRKEFPEKLEFSLSTINDIENVGETQAVIPRLLAVNLGICEISDDTRNLKLPVQLMFGEQIKNVPIAIRINLYSLNSFMDNGLEESIFRRIHLGTIVSPNDWICYHGCHGIRYFKVIQMYLGDISQNTSSSSLIESNVARISENTVIEFIKHLDKGFYILDESLTNLKFQGKSQWMDKVTKKLGGLDEVISEIIEQIYLFIISVRNNKYRKIIKRSKGILLTGNPGTGKTALALCLAESSGLPFTVINCPDIFKTDEGDGENELCSIFKSMMCYPISIIILDEIDVIADKMTSVRSGVESKLYSILIKLLDSINTLQDSFRGQIFVIGKK